MPTMEISPVMSSARNKRIRMRVENVFECLIEIFVSKSFGFIFRFSFLCFVIFNSVFDISIVSWDKCLSTKI